MFKRLHVLVPVSLALCAGIFDRMRKRKIGARDEARRRPVGEAARRCGKRFETTRGHQAERSCHIGRPAHAPAGRLALAAIGHDRTIAKSVLIP